MKAPTRREKALGRIRALMNAGDWNGALKLAASWHDLGDAKDAIESAVAAKGNPRFYVSLGKDPDALYAAGIEALKKRYSEEPLAVIATEYGFESEAELHALVASVPRANASFYRWRNSDGTKRGLLALIAMQEAAGDSNE